MQARLLPSPPKQYPEALRHSVLPPGTHNHDHNHNHKYSRAVPLSLTVLWPLLVVT